ncbi:hypothetical protein GCM10009001_05820 [Virgibacillus siamensis]|uniref:Uncharacterized protein n=1 Tax=Virgibacillus siamensis TaxID=480071 RepID=A0ABP3QK74_9BACI
MQLRQLKPNEFEQAITLADKTFRDKEHISMGTAFPQVFSKNLNPSFGAFEGNELISFMGCGSIKN